MDKVLAALRIDAATETAIGGAVKRVLEKGCKVDSIGRKPRNMLDRRQMRQLEDWLISQAERIENERPLMNLCAAQAAKALGFDVSRGNLKGAWTVLNRGDFPQPKSPLRTIRAHERSRRMMVLANQLDAVLKSLGEKPLPEFEALKAQMVAELKFSH